MVFTFNSDDKSLEVFPKKQDAIASCEGIDVEELPILFWGQNGQALEAVFTKQNERGFCTVVSGAYHLAEKPNGKPLISILEQVSYVEGKPPLNNIEAIRQHLTNQDNLANSLSTV